MKPVTLAVALALLGSAASAQEPPPLTAQRYVEDYTYLADPQRRSGAWWERVKLIPLGANDEAFVTFGNSMRLRYERYWNNKFGLATLPDEGYLRFRFMPYAALQAGPVMRVFAQLNFAYGNRDPRTKNPFTDQTGTELLQGFIDWRVPVGHEAHVTVRGGRQVLVYGSGRLINAGPNIRTSFDGVVAQFEAAGWRVDAFYVRPVRPRLPSFDDQSDNARQVWSLYATWRFGELGRLGLDLYYIGYQDERATFNQGSGLEQRHTAGSRFFGGIGGLKWDLEAHLQAGRFAGGGLFAWAVNLEGRYDFERSPLKPWIGVRNTVMSGDRDRHDGTLGTFNAMFAEGGYFGESGVIGPGNLINLHAAIGLHLAPSVSLQLAGILYWRESLGDGIYGLGGEVLRADEGSLERFIGTQGDLSASWVLRRELTLAFSYSILLPGAFIKDSGPAQTVHFFGAQVQSEF